jgi:hypothetical protein
VRAVFVRRTFSASVIILWHSRSWWNQSYPQKSDVSTIVRTLYLIWMKLSLQDWSHTRLPDLDNQGTIYSWRNLTALIQIKHAPPSSINWSEFEALRYDTWTIWKELLFCQIYLKSAKLQIQLELIFKIQDSSFSFC